MFDYESCEWDKFLKWKKEHDKDCLPDMYTGAIGGKFTHIFTPTSLGTAKQIKCCICKKEVDVTDYDSW